MTATTEEIIAHVKNRIGSYKAPRTVTFVESPPLTAVGKVIRRVVKEKYYRGARAAVVRCGFAWSSRSATIHRL